MHVIQVIVIKQVTPGQAGPWWRRYRPCLEGRIRPSDSPGQSLHPQITPADSRQTSSSQCVVLVHQVIMIKQVTPGPAGPWWRRYWPLAGFDCSYNNVPKQCALLTILLYFIPCECAPFACAAASAIRDLHSIKNWNYLLVCRSSSPWQAPGPSQSSANWPLIIPN